MPWIYIKPPKCSEIPQNLNSIFERRTEKDCSFLKTGFSVIKLVLFALHIVLFFVCVFFQEMTHDGITGGIATCHVAWLILNLVPILIGITFKNRKIIIIILEIGTFIVLGMICLFIYVSLPHSSTQTNLYCDYSIFYNLNLKEKVWNFFKRELYFSEALFVLLPLLISVHILILPFEVGFLEIENAGQTQNEAPNPVTSNPEGSASGSNPEGSASGSTRIMTLRELNDFEPNQRRQGFPRASRSPDLNRISEAPSLESLERGKIEQENSSQACGSSDNVSESVFIENELNPNDITNESKGNLKDGCNEIEESSDSEQSSVRDLEAGVVEIEKSEMSCKRSNLKNSSQENFEKSPQETEKCKSKFQEDEEVSYDPLKRDKNEVVRPLDKRKKSQKPSENYCEKVFSQSSKSSDISKKPQEISESESESEHL